MPTPTTDNEDDLQTLIQNFDRIYQGYNNALLEIQSLKLSNHHEKQRREALEGTCNDLQADNVRLRRIHSASLCKIADQMKWRTKFLSLQEELEKTNSKCLNLEEENKKISLLNQKNELMIHDLQKQLSCSILQQEADKAMIYQLQQDLASREAQVAVLAKNLEHVTANLDLKYHYEIEGLKDCVLLEQDENNNLKQKLQNAEDEIQVVRKKQAEQPRDAVSLNHVEILKQKVMKLRKENESLKRRLAAFKHDDP